MDGRGKRVVTTRKNGVASSDGQRSHRRSESGSPELGASLRQHYNEDDYEKSGLARLEPQLVWHMTAVILVTDTSYLVIALCLGLYHLAILASVALSIGLLLLWFAVRRKFTLAKGAILVNWVLGTMGAALVLPMPSTGTVLGVLFSGVTVFLFEDVHPGNPRLCVLVAVSSSIYLAILTNAHDRVTIFREPISSERFTFLESYLSPLVPFTALLILLSVMFHLKKVYIHREVGLARERRLVERIVCGLLPRQIVDRLKQGENYIADFRPHACIMFLDIVNFSAISSHLRPRQLVEGLRRVFSLVEDRVKCYPCVEKIKTIGDAFMCSAGALELGGEQESVEQVIRLALDLRDMRFDLVYLDDKGRQQAIPIQFRFGVHCGEVIAGVLSTERFAFDLIGDAVNVASRMESLSSPSRILVSDRTKKALIGCGFAFENHGVVDVKGKGKMQTWFVERG